MPTFYIFQSGWLGYIINENYTMCIFKISWNQTSISLLSGSIPHLKPEVLSIFWNIFYIKINSYSCLFNHYEIDTLYPYSNLLLVYLSIIDVLPTPWSPRNTTLNFCAFLLLDEEVKLILCLIFILLKIIYFLKYIKFFKL